MKYVLWLKQQEQGCDYTVGCGQKIFELMETDIDKATDEAKQIIIDNTHSECNFEQAAIFHCVRTADVKAIIHEHVEREAAAQAEVEREEKLRQYEKLKAELNL